MLKKMASWLTVGFFTLGLGMPQKAVSAPAPSSSVKEICSELPSPLEQEVNSWFSSGERPKKKMDEARKKLSAPTKFHEQFNPYKYNFHQFGIFYPFAASGIFPQQYIAGGTLMALPVPLETFSAISRFQLQGTSDYLSSKEFSPLITPQAEMTLVFFNPEAQRNIMLYYARDAQTITQRAKALGVSKFYAHTPGLIFRFRADNVDSEEEFYSAQGVLSYGNWFLGGRYSVDKGVPGQAFLFGTENLYVVTLLVPEVRSWFASLTAQRGGVQYSLQGESTPEKWEVTLNILGSITEAELLGK